ncbi:MAG: DNA/RNA non-specific endonuclease [Prolixibacteraceae bacterium]
MKSFLTFFLLLIFKVVCFGSVNYLPVPAQEIVLHKYYTLSYNEQKEQANWVCYTLTDSMILNGGEERSNSFKMDKLVVTGSAKSSDYTKSGYDRGHLCPAADMGFEKEAMEESFFMSNISPQVPEFNRGIWKELESKVREWAKKEHEIIVVTGPVFINEKTPIGKDNVAVPGYFFKIILDNSDKQRIVAFLLPNAGSEKPLTDFALTTDSLENLTGYDFFSQLPDNLENTLEGKVELAGWFEGYEVSEPVAVQAVPQQQKSDIPFYLILVLVILVVVIFVYLKGKRRK